MSVAFGPEGAEPPRRWRQYVVAGGPENGRPYYSNGETVQWEDPAHGVVQREPQAVATRTERAPSVASGQENESALARKLPRSDAGPVQNKKQKQNVAAGPSTGRGTVIPWQELFSMGIEIAKHNDQQIRFVLKKLEQNALRSTNRSDLKYKATEAVKNAWEHLVPLQTCTRLLEQEEKKIETKLTKHPDATLLDDLKSAQAKLFVVRQRLATSVATAERVKQLAKQLQD
jgi:hypothetical protein